jgi:hypothetical protein
VRQISRDKDQKKEGNTRNSLRGLDRRKARRRRRSGGGAPAAVGAPVWRRCGEGGEEGRGAGCRGGLGAPFIGVSGEEKGREGGGGEVGGRPLMAARCGRRVGEGEGVEAARVGGGGALMASGGDGRARGRGRRRRGRGDRRRRGEEGGGAAGWR